jgi:hypothetical protein
MARDPRFHFPHSRKGEGTFDSICTNCFVTVATGKHEAYLMKLGDPHICQIQRARLYRPSP